MQSHRTPTANFGVTFGLMLTLYTNASKFMVRIEPQGDLVKASLRTKLYLAIGSLTNTKTIILEPNWTHVHLSNSASVK